MSKVDEIKRKMKALQEQLVKIDGTKAGASAKDKDMAMKKAMVIKRLKTGKK